MDDDNGVWVCGIYRDKIEAGVVWDLVGVFSDKEKATAACKDWRYFIYRIEKDQEIGENMCPSGMHYPLAD